MSIFNELLPKLHEISKTYTTNFEDDLKAAFECLDKFESEYQNAKGKAREKALKDKNAKTTLQSIDEDADEATKPTDKETTKKSDSQASNDVISVSRSSGESNPEKPRRNSKKRSKNEVDGLFSPELDKRQKRTASVKANSVISKQVNVNLSQKLRREDVEKPQNPASRRHKEDDKENSVPPLNIQIKQEKVSLPPEPMDMESLPINVEVKKELNKDDIAMPPPMAPVPKPRKGAPKEKSEVDNNVVETGKRRSTRARKQTDTAPASAMPRGTRASSRSARAASEAPTEEPPAETRPKRTRAKKKASDTPPAEPEKETTNQDSVPASPVEKPRPKRTRKAQKVVEKQPEIEEPISQPEPISPTLEPISSPSEPIIPVSEPIIPIIEPFQQISSPILQKEIRKGKNNDTKSKLDNSEIKQSSKKDLKNGEITSKLQDIDSRKLQNEKSVKNINSLIKMDSNTECIKSKDENDSNTVLDETKVISKVEGGMDETVVLPNGVYNHTPVTPKDVRNMNETVVIETDKERTVDNNQTYQIMDATVVLDRVAEDPKPVNLTDDNSLLTDDSDSLTPPRQNLPPAQPSSAVKEKVQQFEELASRVTRTKTRAMAKKEDQTESHTPPDKIVKQVISVDTLNKMNNMIFNGKTTQISSSASKPRAIPVPTKSMHPASASKLSGINRAREAEENQKREKEDARKKKEAMLEAKKESQKRKREEKMAAAAAAREAAERDRRLAMEAAARERMEKQAHADLGKLERMKEAERKKQELARKVAETEERRRAEEVARQQRLADEQRRADAQRRKQIEEAEAMKKEAAIMAKEIEKRQKEYIQKQRKQRLEDKTHTPLKTPGTPGGYYMAPLEPVYMADGFQYLNSDEDDDETVERPVPTWSTSKVRRHRLHFQSKLSQVHIDRLFSVRVHSPDLREIFPGIERARIKRTSSAVWRTPPNRLPALTE